jgi:hypothetical protein
LFTRAEALYFHRHSQRMLKGLREAEVVVWTPICD